MIAREGLIFILIGLVLTVATIWLANRSNSYTLFGISLVTGLLTIFVTFFFRDPDRRTTAAANAIIAPADGRVVVVKQLDSHPFVGDSAVQVSIFLSVFNVHVNRVPLNGVINYVDYNKGEFHVAYADKASKLNEQTEIGMTSEGGSKIVFKQIAGMIARRIVCKLKKGDTVSRGERFGLIRFGSRVDLILPASAAVELKVGDHTIGGETVVGFLEATKQSDGDDQLRSL